MGRYDRLNQRIERGGPSTNAEFWSVGGLKALTKLGNVVIRASYTHERSTDPVTADVRRDKLFTVDLRLMW